MWNNLYEESIQTIENAGSNVFDNILGFGDIDEYFLILLSKGQQETAYSIIEKFNLKEDLKPFYYATLFLLKDERQQEYLRMGSELQGTVDEILQKVEEYRVKYA